MLVDEFLSRLEGVKSRGTSRWVARCPAHKDRSPSLSIRTAPDGRILLHDFGGCEVLQILDALGLAAADLFPERLNARWRAPARPARLANELPAALTPQDVWITVRAEADGALCVHDFGGNPQVLEQLELRPGELVIDRFDGHRSKPMLRPHLHAAADALHVMRHEALVLIYAANDMAAGVILSPKARERMLQSALTIRGAAKLV